MEWREAFAAWTRREGYALGSVFTDIRGRDESGLNGLAEYLRRDGVVGVVVPDLGHLTHVRCLAGRATVPAGGGAHHRAPRTGTGVTGAVGGLGSLDTTRPNIARTPSFTD